LGVYPVEVHRADGMQIAAERAQREVETTRIVAELLDRIAHTEELLQKEKESRENDERAREAEHKDMRRAMRALETERDEARAERDREREDRDRDVREQEARVRQMEDAVEHTNQDVNGMVVRIAELEAALREASSECARLRSAAGDANRLVEEKETQAVALRGKVYMHAYVKCACMSMCMFVIGLGFC
jgi:colicin import membrane protein